ncbi:hypothetical protein [Parasphingorhabdus sp.]|uniref:hypothetical protein n=1 Tax=Parasphingorhabdus sp. TaxID=2709688 RepID=UPI003A9505FE
MSATKKSTLQQLSPTGELISDGFLSAAKSHAAKAIQDGVQPNINKATELLVKSTTVITERYNLPRDLRDALLSATAEVLKLAHREEVQKQEAETQPQKEKAA